MKEFLEKIRAWKLMCPAWMISLNVKNENYNILCTSITLFSQFASVFNHVVHLTVFWFRGRLVEPFSPKAILGVECQENKKSSNQ
jgi:hypothetical protein